MTDKTEAQPEALRLAAEFEDCIRIDAIPSINDVKKSAAELRRQHAEIQQLKAQLSARQAAPDERLRTALERIIGWNRDHANELCGDPDRAEGWACVREARAALSAALSTPEREPLTDEQIEAAYKNLQVRRNKDQDEAFQAGIGKSCMHCSEGHYQADWNGYSTFHRCNKCRHVPFDLSGLVKKSATSCWCETCRPNTLSDMRMVLCPDCGNKRCPKATHHDNACTNSNAPGQPGSSWEHVKPHGATNDNP
ncbi:hypothetical protein [Comamonas sp. B21-038]|uniref:hypothetical protein n=1 Tax=Comamonas sp. B21-038 TaxID=2918299 RepID=UPI001EFB0F69|nr:hypothetical protein [Comamonas sp. B21-038]ULR87447.1 hypothetical protein MJ205_13340 [Comamonas sp. B21-038]